MCVTVCSQEEDLRARIWPCPTLKTQEFYGFFRGLSAADVGFVFKADAANFPTMKKTRRSRRRKRTMRKRRKSGGDGGARGGDGEARRGREEGRAGEGERGGIGKEKEELLPPT
ncbi:hypothetical protein PoB_003760700 [Plakobranchus ocellatus]|uniref:Uncharacterized protein n=1 Tax=Plakobranchus ocellatus TaxID=259542 RepID=A0AAV4AVY1_9GAST|nr:hypothetical protein PoB_003760700 [Plakobranchus ocellatus]